MHPLLIVGKREILVRVKSKIFGWMFLSFIILATVLPWIPKILGHDVVKPFKIGVVSESSNPGNLIVALSKVNRDDSRIRFDFVPTSYASTHLSIFSKEKFSAILDIGQDKFLIFKRNSLPSDVLLMLEGIQNAYRNQGVLQKLHVSIPLYNSSMSNFGVSIITIDDVKRATNLLNQRDLVVEITGLFFLYGLLILSSTLLAYGIVEEKSSKVIEVILTSIKPSHLLSGKVLGITIFASIQSIVIGSVGLASNTLAHNSSVGSLRFSQILVFILWFVPALIFFGYIFASLGSAINRLEDMGAVQTPLFLMMVFCLGMGLKALFSPYSGITAIASYVPPFSFFVDPILTISKHASAIHLLIAYFVSVACTFGVVIWSIRLFDLKVIDSGAKYFGKTAKSLRKEQASL